MRGWGLLAGFRRFGFHVSHAFVEPAELPLQHVDFFPLACHGFVQLLDRLFLMDQPDFEVGDARFRVDRDFFSVSGHGLFP